MYRQALRGHKWKLRVNRSRLHQRKKTFLARSTGVDKGGGAGGPAPPLMAGQKKFFVKIEGLSS